MRKEIVIRNREQNGITLIALVVTILVLTILAGITIGTLKENKIIDQTKDAQIMTELANVKEALETYKIKKHSNGEMSDEELVIEGILKEVTIQDTGRTIAIITSTKKIESETKLGKAGKKIGKNEYGNILDLRDVYAIDMSDGTLYYIRDGIWSIEGKKVKYINQDGMEKEGWVVETVDEKYLEARKFITEWQVNDNTEITLPIPEEPNIKIEWGDGTIEEYTTTQPKHTYNNAGIYQIKITGKLRKWDFAIIKESKDYIIGIKQWGNTEMEVIGFSFCTNLSGTIPSHKTNGEFSKISEVSSMFKECRKLTGSIPEDLFKECKNIEYSAFNCFQNCTGLTGGIPENLFSDCEKIKNVAGFFSGCTGLTGNIPANLFTNNSKLQITNSVFYGCTGLTGEIPKELFTNNNQLKSMEYTFSGCSGISGKIPEGLLKNCPNLTTVYLMFNGTSISEIPVNIFDTNGGKANSIKIIAGAFQGTKIKEIPEGLFDLCTNATNFGNNYSYSGTFQDCTNLETIPDRLFYKNTKANSFANLFKGCKKLKDVPENMFNTQEPSEAASMFADCTSLKKVSGRILQGIPNMTNMEKMFINCSSLEEIGEEFTISSASRSIFGMFYGCNLLNVLPSRLIIPENVTNIEKAFERCEKISTTIVLKSTPTEYKNAFSWISSTAKLNWSNPCTEQLVDVILKESFSATGIKGVEE